MTDAIRPLEELYAESPPKQVLGPSGRIYGGMSLLDLRPHHEPRRSAIFIVEHRAFDPFVLLSILANCITMAAQSPLDDCCTDKAHLLAVCEDVFLAIFTMELLLKVLAYTLISHRNAYLRDSWCQLDFTVVVLGWLPILLPSMGNYSGLRAFRALRPLRALKRLPGMPVLVQWIIDVLPKMADVVLLCTFMFLVFGNVGLELFKGTLHYRCALPGFDERAPLVEEKAWDSGIACRMGADEQCTTAPSDARCAYFGMSVDGGMSSFDSIGGVTLALAKSVSFDHWADQMYQSIGSASPYAWVYFVLVVVIGGFFVVNLFLAVIYLAFASSQTTVLGAGARAQQLQTPSQSAADSPAHTPDLTPQPTAGDGNRSMDADARDTQASSLCSGCLRATTASVWFSRGSTALVLANMVLMCLPYEGMAVEYAQQLEDVGLLIACTFVLEMVLKLGGFGCAGYWADKWNTLDGTLVLLSLPDIAASFLAARSDGVNLSYLRILRVLRMLRVLRILRLMRSWRGLYVIISTFLRVVRVRPCPHVASGAASSATSNAVSSEKLG